MLVLAATTGIVDAVSVLGLGQVFTANMTGNVVFLGLAAAGASGFNPPVYLWAIATFMAGALIAGRIGKAAFDLPIRRWLIVAATVEAVLLWVAAAVALGFDVETQQPRVQHYAIIALTALAMGFRNATVRQLKIPDITTTVLTLTLTGLAADSTLGGGDNPNWGRRIASVGALFAGAAVGAAMVLRWSLAPPLLLAGALVLASTLIWVMSTRR
jgi:uncharacterized membrane protein YoaK (UPF0700 family)